jgi:hypothetical protein
LRLTDTRNRSFEASDDRQLTLGEVCRLSKRDTGNFTDVNVNLPLLFVRMENENYCCLGDLKYVAVDLDSSPIKIKWELNCFEKLRYTEYFQRILDESRTA